MPDSTTTNGVVLKIPYAIIKNFVRVRPFTLSIIGIDPTRPGITNSLREFPASLARANQGMFVYVGDVIRFRCLAPCNDATADAFDLVQVNPSTGVETTQTTLRFTAVWQQIMTVTVTAVDGTSGAVTYTTSYL